MCETEWDRLRDISAQLQGNAVAGYDPSEPSSTYGKYLQNFKLWSRHCTRFNLPIWLDQVSAEERNEVILSFAASCHSEGQNPGKKGNLYGTFRGKMSAVQHMHLLQRHFVLDMATPVLKLATKGYQRLSPPSEQKEPVSRAMLRQLGHFAEHKNGLGSQHVRRILNGSSILAFFLLDRRGEMWAQNGRPNPNVDRHLLRFESIIITDLYMRVLSYPYGNAHSVTVRFGSTKPDQRGVRKSVIYLFKTLDEWFCPVLQCVAIFTARHALVQLNGPVGPYLTSISPSMTICGRTVAGLLKDSATALGLSASSYSLHSLRIGGACALLAAGYGPEVIKLMGRWASWCFTIYLRVEPDTFRDVARKMAQAYKEAN